MCGKRNVLVDTSGHKVTTRPRSSSFSQSENKTGVYKMSFSGEVLHPSANQRVEQGYKYVLNMCIIFDDFFDTHRLTHAIIERSKGKISIR